MNDQRRASGFGSDRGGKLGISVRGGGNSGESRQVLSERDEFSRDEQRILDVLERGLSREYPNPDRIGCPGSAVLRGIASHKLRLAEVHQWLDHLGSCSPCYQEFTERRKQVVSQRRRLQVWLAVAAVLILTVAALVWVRTQRPGQQPEIAVLDLRERSVARGQNPTQPDQPPLEIRRSAKHLIVDLPIGSREGSYDLALLTESGDQLRNTSGTARLQDHVVTLRADVDVTGIQPGTYLLALRQPGLEWTRYPVRVL